MTTFNTWKRFFQEQDGAAGNKAFASLLNLVREGTDSEKAGKLRTEAETVGLARHPEGSVVFVHHLSTQSAIIQFGCKLPVQNIPKVWQKTMSQCSLHLPELAVGHPESHALDSTYT